jgi:ribonuclease P protein component
VLAHRARWRLGARRRLARRVDFERLLRDGRRRSESGFTFYTAGRTQGPPRLGLLVTRRHAARASDRNRLKRCIREAFRLEQARLDHLDILVRPPLSVRSGRDLVARLRVLFAKLAP